MVEVELAGVASVARVKREKPEVESLRTAHEALMSPRLQRCEGAEAKPCALRQGTS
jgi:hypothetical protein